MRRVNRVANSLKQDILNARIAVSSFLPTEKQLQAQFNVSRSTIRRALEELIADGWAERQPNKGVQARMGSVGARTSIVGFIDHTDDLHKTLFFYLGQYLSEVGLHLVHLDSTQVGTMGALEKAANSGFAASVFWGKEVFIDQARMDAVQAQMPVVAVDHCPNGIKVDVVRGDHFDGARQATEHLVNLGRKQIAISGFHTLLPDSDLRLLGFSAGHIDNGLGLRAHNLVFSSIPPDNFDDPRLLTQRLSEKDRPDAVFVLHDLSTPAIASAIFDAGLRIPEDVAIVGYGNDLPLTLGEVGLSTVAMDWQGIAQALMARIRHRIDHPISPVEETVLPARLVVRGSCGAPQDSWHDAEYQVSSATITRRMPRNMWRSEFGTNSAPPLPNSLNLRAALGRASEVTNS